MSDNSPDTRFGTRRGFLLNRFAYTCGTAALIIAVFYNESGKWPVVLGIAAVGVASWWLGNKLDKKARRTIEVDEKGNVKKKVL